MHDADPSSSNEELTTYTTSEQGSEGKAEFHSYADSVTNLVERISVNLSSSSSSEEEEEQEGLSSYVLLIPKKKKKRFRRRRRKMSHEELDDENVFPEDPVFNDLMRRTEAAIEMEIYPERIIEGSSGSYFVKDCDNVKIGVFKPGDEEPYAEFNPKFQKFLQKTCCPFWFGRGCLVPNQGYLSEAGASMVDEMIGLNIVPKTKVVHLASPTFNYSVPDRAAAATKKHVMEHFPRVGRRFSRIGLPKKIGSFQTFVNGYEPASTCVHKLNNDDIGEVAVKSFLLQFQKLVVLDYITRNTDRGNDNWLIKYDQADMSGEDAGPDADWGLVSHPTISIAAIDNGLAFPYKHPDEWRRYPYYWAWLAEAEKDFCDEVIEQVLPLISDMNFVEKIVSNLGNLFSVDEDFDEDVFSRQMAVMRGQILNLTQCLKDKKSPQFLVNMTCVTVERRDHHGHPSGRVVESGSYLERIPEKKPFFSWC